MTIRIASFLLLLNVQRPSQANRSDSFHYKSVRRIQNSARFMSTTGRESISKSDRVLNKNEDDMDEYMRTKNEQERIIARRSLKSKSEKKSKSGKKGDKSSKSSKSGGNTASDSTSRSHSRSTSRSESLRKNASEKDLRENLGLVKISKNGGVREKLNKSNDNFDHVKVLAKENDKPNRRTTAPAVHQATLHPSPVPKLKMTSKTLLKAEVTTRDAPTPGPSTYISGLSLYSSPSLDIVTHEPSLAISRPKSYSEKDPIAAPVGKSTSNPSEDPTLSPSENDSLSSPSINSKQDEHIPSTYPTYNPTLTSTTDPRKVPSRNPSFSHSETESHRPSSFILSGSNHPTFLFTNMSSTSLSDSLSTPDTLTSKSPHSTSGGIVVLEFSILLREPWRKNITASDLKNGKEEFLLHAVVNSTIHTICDSPNKDITIFKEHDDTLMDACADLLMTKETVSTQLQMLKKSTAKVESAYPTFLFFANEKDAVNVTDREALPKHWLQFGIRFRMLERRLDIESDESDEAMTKNNLQSIILKSISDRSFGRQLQHNDFRILEVSAVGNETETYGAIPSRVSSAKNMRLDEASPDIVRISGIILFVVASMGVSMLFYTARKRFHNQRRKGDHRRGTKLAATTPSIVDDPNSRALTNDGISQILDFSYKSNYLCQDRNTSSSSGCFYIDEELDFEEQWRGML